MASKATTPYRSWYRRLVSLYPSAYQEKFGESMLQTFDDCYKERLLEQRGSAGFLIHTFVDTGMGIFKEHLAASMTTTPARLITIATSMFGGVLWLGLIGFLGYSHLSIRTGYDFSFGWHIYILVLMTIINAVFTLLSLLIKSGDFIRRLLVSTIVLFIVTGALEAYVRIDEWQIRRTYAEKCVPGAAFDVPRRFFPGNGLFCWDGWWSVHE